jgi:hypothetical protein
MKCFHEGSGTNNQVQESAYFHIPLYGEPKKIPQPIKLTDDELLLAPPIVWGFSLADKLWRAYLSPLNCCSFI